MLLHLETYYILLNYIDFKTFLHLGWNLITSGINCI